jgi:hypothetical protein
MVAAAVHDTGSLAFQSSPPCVQLWGSQTFTHVFKEMGPYDFLFCAVLDNARDLTDCALIRSLVSTILQPVQQQHQGSPM